MALTVWQRTIADLTGKVVPGAVLLVSREEDGSLAAVYKDRGGADPWPAGTVTADGFGFARFYAEPGRYRIQSLGLAIDWRDIEMGFQETDQLRVGGGSAGVPAISFGPETNSGLYRVAAHQIGIATDGQARLALSNGRVWFGVQAQAQAGSGAAPGYSFDGDTDTGIFNGAPDTLNFATGGSSRLGITGADVQSSVPIRIPAGGALTPSLSFGLEASTGLFRGDTGVVDVAVDGVHAYRMRGVAMFPLPDASRSLGVGGFRWSVVFAATGTINTSDAREKTDVAPMTEAEIAAAKYLAKSIGTYRWLASIQEKGEGRARTHVGLTVQQAIEVMERHGLDPFAYAFICHDEWGEEHDAEGNVMLEAGDRYAFRPDQLAMFIARGLEARISALEAAMDGD